jgi:hypothetical protein
MAPAPPGGLTIYLHPIVRKLYRVTFWLQYDNGMSSPAVISGNVVEPAHISQPHSYAAHDFFNVIRDIVHQFPHHNEADKLAARTAVDAYEKHVTGPDSSYVKADSDRAVTEDVSLRVGPNSTLPVLAPAQAIDYARLAAAIVAASAAQAQALGGGSTASGAPVPDITSGNPTFPRVVVPG